MAKQRKLETSQEEESRANLTPDDFNYGSGHNNSVIIDFLSYIRGQYLEKIDKKNLLPHFLSTWLQSILESFCSMIAEAFARMLNYYPIAQVIHVIFSRPMPFLAKRRKKALKV